MSMGFDILLNKYQTPNHYIIYTSVNAKDIITVEDKLQLVIKDVSSATNQKS